MLVAKRPIVLAVLPQPEAQFCERVLGRAILGYVRRTEDDFETVGRRSNVDGRIHLFRQVRTKIVQHEYAALVEQASRDLQQPQHKE